MALRALLVARAQIVSQITTVKNCVRGILKTFGHILPKKLRATYIVSVREIIEGHTTLEPILMPMIRTLASTMEQLQVYDRAINRFARHSETARHLMTAPGVGTVVALAYITGVETPARFSRSSAVGAYFGMTPRRYQSGEVDQTGRVSKCGDGMVRGLLYEAAKVLLSRSAKPSDLQGMGSRAHQAHRQEEGDDGRRSQARGRPASHVDNRRAVSLDSGASPSHGLIAPSSQQPSSSLSPIHCPSQ
jgi:transposase